MCRPALLIALAIFALAVLARVLPSPRTVDDAFITFRYSRNLVEGQGFVYNPGVRTLGTTTPLFTLVMAAISVVTGRQDFQWYALTVSALADGGTAALLYLLARRLSGRDSLSALPGILWAVAPRSVTFAVGGMETSLTILWMVTAFWIYVRLPGALRRNPWLKIWSGSPLQGLALTGKLNRTRQEVFPESVSETGGKNLVWGDGLIGVLAGLGVLTRIDALLWIAPLFGWQVLESWRLHRRLPWWTWLAFGLTLLPWLAFSAAYFGSPFPNSINAKSAAYQMPPASALIVFIQTYATPFFEYETFGAGAIGLGGLLYLTLSLVAILYTARRLPRLLPFLAYPWLYLIVFSAANPLIFRWYLVPPLPALMLGIFAGAWVIVNGIQEQSGRRWLTPAAFAGLGLLWLGMSLNAWTLHPDHGADRPAPEMAWHKIELLYQDIGTELREGYRVSPETRVASADIGAIGYFSRATIVDTVGLVTPEMRRYYPISPALIAPGQNYAIPPPLIFDTQPDYLVTMEAFVRLGLEQDAAFRAGYELVREIPTDFYGTGMRLYRRVGAAVAPQS